MDAVSEAETDADDDLDRRLEWLALGLAEVVVETLDDTERVVIAVLETVAVCRGEMLGETEIEPVTEVLEETEGGVDGVASAVE